MKQRRGKVTSKELTSTYGNIPEHISPRSWKHQKGTAEQAPRTQQVRHTAQMIIDINEPGQRNGQCLFEMASKRTGEQGQQLPPMGNSRAAANRALHCITIEPENALLQQDTPVRGLGNPHGQSQDTETASMAQ